MAEQELDQDGLPKVHDEAGETPRWVPVLGLCLLGLFSLMAVYRAATAEPETPAVEVEEGEAGAEGEAAPTPAAEAEEAHAH